MKLANDAYVVNANGIVLSSAAVEHVLTHLEACDRQHQKPDRVMASPILVAEIENYGFRLRDVTEGDHVADLPLPDPKTCKRTLGGLPLEVRSDMAPSQLAFVCGGEVVAKIVNIGKATQS